MRFRGHDHFADRAEAASTARALIEARLATEIVAVPIVAGSVADLYWIAAATAR